MASLIDEIKISASAGDGGNGVVRWRQEKFVPKGGPAGGDGGRGGDFYIKGVRDIGILAKYKAKKEFKAEKGEDGQGKSLHGRKGDDFFLELPIGSIVTNLDTGQKWQLLKENDTELILKGGYGGYGNEHFKSSVNTTPKEFNYGEKGEQGEFLVELELFADLGLIGLPNAGKSSLLNMLTNAEAKIGDYPFTTLDPNLGDFYGYIIADIPGLIEGASEGKGLGIKFLRHIKRTKMLAHLVSFENEDMMQSYKDIRNELKKYDEKALLLEDGLTQKKEIIILTKTDTTDFERIEQEKFNFEKLEKEVLVVSLFDDQSIKNLQTALSQLLQDSDSKTL